MCVAVTNTTIFPSPIECEQVETNKYASLWKNGSPDIYALEKLGQYAGRALIYWLELTDDLAAQKPGSDEYYLTKYCLEVWEQSFLEITNIHPQVVIDSKP